jgi:uncharacterized protein (TIGR02145 family)
VYNLKSTFMHFNSRILSISVFFVFNVILFGCKKDDANKIPADKIPIVETIGTYLETNSTVGCSGIIGSDHGYTVTVRGFCWSSTNNTPTTGDYKSMAGAGAGAFSDTVVGLKASTRYYLRAFATNAAGTGYGSTMSFVTTAPTIGEVVTGITENISQTSATCKGEVLLSGGVDVFEKGICYGSEYDPTINDNKAVSNSADWSFSVNLDSLTPNTVYVYRSYITNSQGTAYGANATFKTKVVYFGQVTDVEGNVYPTVKILDKVWMAENLKTTKYNDGTAIELVTDDTKWINTTTPAYCWYNNEPPVMPGQGALYNAYVVNTGKVCPVGWHVPTEAEFQQLWNHCSGPYHMDPFAVADSVLQSEANSTGLSVIFSGYRSAGDGYFGEIQTTTYGQNMSTTFWSSSVNSDFNSIHIYYDAYQHYSMAQLESSLLNEGVPIRCIED